MNSEQHIKMIFYIFFTFDASKYFICKISSILNIDIFSSDKSHEAEIPKYVDTLKMFSPTFNMVSNITEFFFSSS